MRFTLRPVEFGTGVHDSNTGLTTFGQPARVAEVLAENANAADALMRAAGASMSTHTDHGYAVTVTPDDFVFTPAF